MTRFSDPRSVILMVCRPQFDNYLVEQNRKDPHFRFFDGERVEQITHDGRFQVRTARRLVTAPQLIGADGAYSLVNRTFAIAKPRAVATAVEVNVPRTEIGALERFVPCFDYGAIPRGYGWIFPKDDQLSIGLYTLAPHT